MGGRIPPLQSAAVQRMRSSALHRGVVAWRTMMEPTVPCPPPPLGLGALPQAAGKGLPALPCIAGHPLHSREGSPSRPPEAMLRSNVTGGGFAETALPKSSYANMKHRCPGHRAVSCSIDVGRSAK